MPKPNIINLKQYVNNKEYESHQRWGETDEDCLQRNIDNLWLVVNEIARRVDEMKEE